MRHLIIAAALLSGGQAGAQGLPGFFDVSGVAADDVLNVRAAPTPEADILETLAPNAVDVQVSALNEAGTWGRIVSGEAVGWVSMSYLAAAADGTLPQVAGLRCFGTEPFWSYEVRQEDTATWQTPDSSATLLAGPIETASGMTRPFSVVAGADDLQAVLVASPEAACSDGMSDRLYGLSAVLVLTGRVAGSYGGCCELVR